MRCATPHLNSPAGRVESTGFTKHAGAGEGGHGAGPDERSRLSPSTTCEYLFRSAISESISNYICNANIDIGIVDIDSDTVEASVLVYDLAWMNPTPSLSLILLLML